MRKELQHRVEKVRAKSKLKDFYFVKHHEKFPSLIERITCKCCGATLLLLTAHPKYEWKEGDKTIRLATLAPTANYDEMTIEFEDGSAHVTCMCRKCCRITDKGRLEEIYMADVAQFQKEGMTNYNGIDRVVRGRGK